MRIMDQEKSALTERYWADFVENAGIDGRSYCVVTFGTTKIMANDLLSLVLSGRKRATTSLLRDYHGDTPLPQVGDYVVVLDGSAKPRCIWQTTELTVKPFVEVDESFAWTEGEGDGSLDYWLSAHRKYFSSQSQVEDFEMHDRIETVFEKFQIVWPLDLADPAA